MWLSKLAYIRFGLSFDSSMLLTQAPLGIPLFQTSGALLVQVLPPSVVTCRLPSSVPTQITFSLSGCCVMVKMVQWFSADVLSPVIPPLSSVFCFAGSLVLRSGEIRIQLRPSSVERYRYWLAMYKLYKGLPAEDFFFDKPVTIGVFQ